MFYEEWNVRECIYQASRMTHTIHLGENVNINVFVYKKTALDMFNWDFWGQPVQQNISKAGENKTEPSDTEVLKI